MSNFSNAHRSRQRVRQRGDAMLEALIGVLLTFILGGGVAFVASRIVAGQRDMKVENYAVGELRQKLYDTGTGSCASSSASVVTSTISGQTSTSGTKGITITCAAATTVKVSGGTEVPEVLAVSVPQKVTLTVANSEIGLSDSGSAVVTVGSEQ